MRRSRYMLAVITLVAIVLAITGAGCKKKVAPPPPPPPKVETPPPPPPPAAPTIRLSASPASIEQGQSSTLSWNASNATSVTIDNGVGNVPASGTRSVSPTTSTSYTARATGPGGNTSAEARITVTAPPPLTPPPVKTITDAEFFETNVKDVYFDYDKYEIRPDAEAVLQANARALGERSGIRFTIEGHCDERGSEKYNLALGDRRANAVREYMLKLGVSPERIDTVSYGKERPTCTEHTEECWQQNRKGHFLIR
jgi:peptidoglycan-associated lipoprotein